MHGSGAAEIETFDAPGIGVSGTMFRATDLPAGDVLNVRIDPGSSATIVGALTGREIVSVERCTPDPAADRWERASFGERRAMIAASWCLVVGEGIRGWAYGRYLAPVD